MISSIHIVVVIIIVTCGTHGFFINSGNSQGTTPIWRGLSSTFLKFSSLPRTAKDAEKQYWTKTDNCDENAYFRGNRYVLKNDHGPMLLFDSNGNIAGIQIGIPKSEVTGNFYNQAAFVDDGDMFVLTAYFNNPDEICNGKRKDTKYVGDSLSIQIGPTPSSLMKIPLVEQNITPTKWVKGKCVVGMGQHYWYDISIDMKCDEYFPAFLLYNGGKLNAFGFLAIADLKGSRYEHPPPSVLGYFYQSDSYPKCVKELPDISTIHVYLDRRPYFNFC